MSAHRFLERAGSRETLRRLYRIEIRGAERIPASGAAIVVANHESIWDPFVLSVATQREIEFMAKAELFRLPLVAAARALTERLVEAVDGA